LLSSYTIPPASDSLKLKVQPEQSFNDGDITDWTVTTFGTGTFDTSSDKYVSAPYSVRMNSYGNSKAMGVSPLYIYDANLSENYDVSFSFLIPDADNHWFEVFNSHQIYVVIDSGDDLKCYDGSKSYLIDELTANQWYLIEIKAHPSSETYDVYIDSQFKKTCDMWIYTGFENNFRIGDRENTSTDYGQAYWDDFVVTQPVDSDQDGVVDPNDNCPYDYNPNQADRNDDGWGDVCECFAANIDDVNLVDFKDFSIFAVDWKEVAANLQGDINGDDIVDNNDLEILAYHWLSNCL
jgi:hypothetical protein